MAKKRTLRGDDMYYKIVLTEKFKTEKNAKDIVDMLVKDGWNQAWFEIVEVS